MQPLYFCLAQLVIANVLQTRKHRVVFVTPTDSYELHLSREHALQGLEIEEPIVADVVSGGATQTVVFSLILLSLSVSQVQKHSDFIASAEQRQ